MNTTHLRSFSVSCLRLPRPMPVEESGHYRAKTHLLLITFLLFGLIAAMASPESPSPNRDHGMEMGVVRLSR